MIHAPHGHRRALHEGGPHVFLRDGRRDGCRPERVRDRSAPRPERTPRASPILPTDSPLVMVDPPLGTVVRKATATDVFAMNKHKRMEEDATEGRG